MNFPFGLTRKVTKVNLDDLRASAERVFATHTLPNVTAFIDDSMGATPVLCVTEDERSHSTPIGDVARRIERSRPAEPGDPLTAGIIEWLRHRPITDAQARATGVAALGWANGRETAVAWHVVVHREGITLPWIPSPHVTANEAHRTRSAAIGRSFEIDRTLNVQGDVALWTASDLPMLSTALLIDPERLLTSMALRGVTARDMHVVIAPDRPVICASADAARRLAGETSEAHVILPWREVADLGWM